MRKPRRRRVTFNYHLDILCYPDEAKKLHDQIHKVTAQAIADFTGETIDLTDCKTGKIRGSVKPRR